MLLATAGQTVPYTNNLHGGGGGGGGVGSSNSANVGRTNNNNNNSSSSSSSNSSQHTANHKKLTASVNNYTNIANNNTTANVTTTAASAGSRQRQIQAHTLLLPRAPVATHAYSNCGGSINSGSGSGSVGINNDYDFNRTAGAAASTLMKTLSVRLHRGREFLKDTVQKALIVASKQTYLGDKTGVCLSDSTAAKIASTSTNLSVRAAPTTTSRVAAAAAHDATSSTSSSTSSSQAVASTSAAAAARAGATTYHVQRALAAAAASSVTASTSAASAFRRLNVAPSAAFLKLYTVPPTALHRSNEARLRTASTDSLIRDVCHFKPIRPMPISGSKSSAAAARTHKLQKIYSPRALSAASAKTKLFNIDCDDEDDDDDVDGSKKRAQQQPKTSAAIVLKPTPSATKLQLSKPHSSAFVCLIASVDWKTTAATTRRGTKRQQTRTSTAITAEPPVKRVRERTTRNSKLAAATEVINLPNDIKLTTKKAATAAAATRKRRQNLNEFDTNDLLPSKRKIKDCNVSNVVQIKMKNMRTAPTATPTTPNVKATATQNCAMQQRAVRETRKRKLNVELPNTNIAAAKKQKQQNKEPTPPPAALSIRKLNSKLLQQQCHSPPMTRLRTRRLQISNQQQQQQQSKK